MFCIIALGKQASAWLFGALMRARPKRDVRGVRGGEFGVSFCMGGVSYWIGRITYCYCASCPASGLKLYVPPWGEGALWGHLGGTGGALEGNRGGSGRTVMLPRVNYRRAGYYILVNDQTRSIRGIEASFAM